MFKKLQVNELSVSEEQRLLKPIGGPAYFTKDEAPLRIKCKKELEVSRCGKMKKIQMQRLCPPQLTRPP